MAQEGMPFELLAAMLVILHIGRETNQVLLNPSNRIHDLGVDVV